MSQVRDTNMNFEDFVDQVRRMSNGFDFNNTPIEEIKSRVDLAFNDCMYRGVSKPTTGLDDTSI